MYIEDEFCMNCKEEDERVYIGDGEFYCMNCNEITDFNRVRIGIAKQIKEETK